jgi:hypothetical protein
MSEHVSQEELLSHVIDLGDESILVSARIEHDQDANLIRRWKVNPKLGETRPLAPLRQPVPSIKRRRICARMFRQELADLLAADHMHYVSR